MTLTPTEFSPYAQRLINSGRINADLVENLSQQLPLAPSALRDLIVRFTPAHHDAEHAAHVGLRLARSHVMLALMAFDLRHAPSAVSLAAVTQTISDFADVCVQHAMQVVRAQLSCIHGEPFDADGEPMPLWVLGMGKLSGHELNVSSDMDLIFVFAHDGQTRAHDDSRVRSLSHHEFFDKLGRRMIKLLDDVSEHGFVFRVDMRLRPYGASGALSLSLAALENYFLTQARAWERFAWLKSRLINPSKESKQLDNLIEPFVFRRYLDYDAIDALRDVHHKIRQKAAHNSGALDIKIGAGGIREIEFIVQLFQIIKGPRNLALRPKATLLALPELAKAQLLDATQVTQLTEHYVFLRHLEHRIQYLNDTQTQRLPTDAADLGKLAAAMQCDDWQTRLEHGNRQVEAHFNQLFEPVNETAHNHPHAPQNDESAELLAQFDEPNTLQERLQRLESDPRLQQLPERSASRYRQLVQRTLHVLTAQHSAPIKVEYALRVLQFLDAIAKRSSYLALLIEHPKALAHVIKLMSRSRWAGDYLTAHPILLDELLTPANLHTPPDWPALDDKLTHELNHAAGDVERQMNILRETQHAQVFRLLAQELDGLWTMEQLADHLSDLTDLLLRQALHFCWLAFPKRHIDAPNFAIIAYGKLGGKEMGYASDLDLVFLFDDAHENADEIYTRFAQRLNNWLTAPTAAGILFDTDYRLRPNGASGLLVSNLNMFKQYQTQSAWFWEHQAITRARFCAGDARMGQWFEQERRAILQTPRERATVVREILEMRDKLQAGHPNHSDLFDVKYDTGGMVDIEFCVQALVLLHSGTHSELLDNKGNIALLQRAAEAGLIDKALAQNCANAYRDYRQLQHEARLQNISQTRVAASEVAPHIAAVEQLRQVILN
ncbi:MAG: bifunctional [glutamate--ammonia ligase]-adenylyl-L-tyrosine phosphorylase/[glutamate--ammonia-ligase] adenylyltransferase [Formosimonas sp.]